MGDWRNPVCNPKATPVADNSGHGASGKGSNESGDMDSGMIAEVVVIPNMGKTKNAPKNEAPDWSA